MGKIKAIKEIKKIQKQLWREKKSKKVQTDIKNLEHTLNDMYEAKEKFEKKGINTEILTYNIYLIKQSIKKLEV